MARALQTTSNQLPDGTSGLISRMLLKEFLSSNDGHRCEHLDLDLDIYCVVGVEMVLGGGSLRPLRSFSLPRRILRSSIDCIYFQPTSFLMGVHEALTTDSTSDWEISSSE
ncbi:hypothetical protein F2Q69_00013598 [Brassica cretica]|uniref:Uncharacterized protein n=1 Tax=Brassica cretica TaxID=69181 RepID=A0A8S9R3C6_BRACR|nr:hypothetical protein F2Q69_00013598 [Brassica cretica]